MASLEIKPSPRQRLRVFSVLAFGMILALFLMFLLVGGSGNLVARRAHLTTYMPDAGGLTTQSEVRLSGIRIGTVDKIDLSGSLDPQRAVRVQMQVLSRYLRSIPADSQTDISADTLIGYQFVDIAEGKSPLPIKEDATLPSEPVKQAADRADLIKAIQDELKQMDGILANMQDPKSDLGSFIYTQTVYDSFVQRIGGISQDLRSVLDPQSDLGKAFYTDTIYKDFHDEVTSLDKTLASIQAGEGAAGHFYASDEQYTEALSELRDLRASIAKWNASLTRDSDGWQQTSRLLKKIDGTIAGLNAGEGAGGRLLTNAQLYESLNGSLKNLEELLRDLRENPRRYLRYKPF